MTAKKSANTKSTERKAPSTAWKPGQSGNPAGRPREGESWASLIKSIGDMTPKAAAAKCKALAGQMDKLGDGVTLKEAVVLAVYASLMMDPNPGLLNAFMDRAEGKVSQPVAVYDWRKEIIEAGGDPDALVDNLFAKVTEKLSTP